MGTLVTVTAATDLAVSVADARNQCRLYDDATHDALLTRLIKAATAEIEVYCCVSLMPKTFRYDLDGFRHYQIRLPVYPVSSVSSVKYDDGDDAEQTVDSGDYYTMLNGTEPYIKVKATWPGTYTGKPASARITFVAGYASANVIPEDLKHAVLLRVYEMFEGLDDNGTARMLASPYRLYQ